MINFFFQISQVFLSGGFYTLPKGETPYVGSTNYLSLLDSSVPVH